MAEWRFFDAGTTPEYATAEWYAERDHAPHLEQDGHRQRLLVTAEVVAEAVRRGGQTIVDLGAGDGGLLQAVRECVVSTVPAWGYDLQPSNVTAAAGRCVQVDLIDFDHDPIDWADIVVMSEVLEHLVDPHAMVTRIFNESDARWLIATSPYTETPDSHYGYHLWGWDLPGYQQMLESGGWQHVSTSTAWISQIVLMERATCES